MSNVKFIRTELKAGRTYQDIGDSLGLTRQRIHQIAKKAGIVGPNYGSRAKVKTRKAAEAKTYRAKWGITKSERSLLLADPLHVKKCEMVWSAKYNAKRAGLPFSITYHDIKFPSHCPVLGIKLNYHNTGRRENNSPSIDKIVPKKGYVPNNVVIVSWRANRLKSDATAKELWLLGKFYYSPKT